MNDVIIDVSEQEIMKNWDKQTDIPLVSIASVTYNHEKFIEKALNSFLMQKTNFPFEIVINDDASTDNTAQIIEKYQEKFPNIFRVNLKKTNVGPSKNTHDAFERCRGKYIAFCEGDDYWTDEHKLQYQIEEMMKHPECGLSFHPVDRVDENNQLIHKKSQYADTTMVFHTPDMIKKIVCPTSSMIYKKENLFKYASFLESIPVGDFFAQIFSSLNGGVLYVNKTMSVYRMHLSGICATRHMDFNKTAIHLQNTAKSIIEADKYLNHKYHDDFMFVIYSATLSMVKNKNFSIEQRYSLYNSLEHHLSDTYKLEFQQLFIELFLKKESNKSKTEILSKNDVDLLTEAAIYIAKSDVKMGTSLLEIAHTAREYLSDPGKNVNTELHN